MRGQVYERKPGVWLIRIDVGRDPLNGKRAQKAKIVHGDRRDADLALAELLVEHGRGALPKTRATVEQLLDRWFEHAETRLSPTTLRGYRRLAKQRIIPAFGARRVDAVTTAELDRFYDRLVASGLDPQTVRNIHSVIRRAFQHALRWGWVDRNPATNTQPPAVRRQRRESLTAEQVRAAVDTATRLDAEFGVFLRLAFATGARRGELCALRWSDLDVDQGTLDVSRSIAAVDGGWVEKPTKTYKERAVTLDTGTLDLLETHRKKMIERAALAGVTPVDDGFVFSYNLDLSRPMHPDTASHSWALVRTTAKLPAWARLHDIRHAHASLLIDGGVPVSAVSERLGHANQHVTLVIYTHAFRKRDGEAAAMIGSLLDGSAVCDPDLLVGPLEEPGEQQGAETDHSDDRAADD